MASEKFVNGFPTTLNGSITNSQTTIVVTDASFMPATPQFSIIVESEIMLVTGVSGSTLTVTRGQEGTSAVSHADTVLVTHINTARSMKQFIADGCQYDTAANRPSAERSGRLYIETDGPIYRDNGSSWDQVQQPWWINKFTPPVGSGTYAWINQGSATITENTNAHILTQAQNAGVSMAIRKKALANTTPYTLTAAFSVNVPNANSSGCCILLRNSGSGKLIFLVTEYSGSFKHYLYYWNSPTSVSTSVGAATSSMNPWLVWFRIVDDGTNRTYYTSVDGNNFVRHTSELRTNFITPDECGYGVYANQNTGKAIMTLLSWKETNP